MNSFLIRLDYWLFDLINQMGAFSWGDVFFPVITDLHHTIYFKILIIPLLIFLFIQKYQRAGLTIFIFLSLTLAFSDFAGSKVKNHFLRLRPFENSEIQATQKAPAGSKSFYSNHASNVFAFATFTSQFIPVLKIPLFLFAALVGYSRIYNGVHYPSDVFAGALMGVVWGLAFSSLTKRILLRFHHRNKLV